MLTQIHMIKQGLSLAFTSFNKYGSNRFVSIGKEFIHFSERPMASRCKRICN